MKTKKQLTLLIAGQFPPPVNGLAYITQEMAKFFSVQCETVTIDLAPHMPNTGLAYHRCRLSLTLKGVVELVRQTKNKKRCFYMACDSDFGLLYNIILGLSARLLRYPIHVHYHSFNFIDSHSVLLSVLLHILGQRCTHIFLCPAMADRFLKRYPLTTNRFVLSNSAFVDACKSPVHEWTPEYPLTLGLLSNLNDEKGLSIFLGLLKRATMEGLNIRGILAGPPMTAQDHTTIQLAEKELGDRLEYLGPVYGNAKNSFLEAIDVFVFPTCYVNEAQPTVIFEAMSYGVPVLTFDRGCIKGQVSMAGAVLAQGEDFIQVAMNWIKFQMSNQISFHQLKLSAKDTFLTDQCNAKEAAATLVSSLSLLELP